MYVYIDIYVCIYTYIIIHEKASGTIASNSSSYAFIGRHLRLRRAGSEPTRVEHVLLSNQTVRKRKHTSYNTTQLATTYIYIYAYIYIYMYMHMYMYM